MISALRDHSEYGYCLSRSENFLAAPSKSRVSRRARPWLYICSGGTSGTISILYFSPGPNGLILSILSQADSATPPAINATAWAADREGTRLNSSHANLL